MSLRGQFSRRRRLPLSDMNVVPYIDVMLVLLVIFMVTAPMLTQGIEVQLPQATNPTLTLDNRPLVVTLTADRRLVLQDGNQQDTVSADDLPTLILQRQEQGGGGRPVFIHGDARVAYGEIIRVMSSLQAAGVTQVGLLTEAPQSP